MAIKGSKKVSARLITNGRSTFFYDVDEVKFEDCPDGALLVNTITGKVKVKLVGKTTWTDVSETISDKSNLVIQGNRLIREPFLVTNIDLEHNIIEYVNARNENRKKFIFTKEKRHYAVFELDKGDYILGYNKVFATVNNIIECNSQNYNLIELTPRRIAIDVDFLALGCWVDVAYYDKFKMNFPGGSMFMAKEEREDLSHGDMQLVFNNMNRQGSPLLQAHLIDGIINGQSEIGSRITIEVDNTIIYDNVIDTEYFISPKIEKKDMIQRIVISSKKDGKADEFVGLSY